MLDTGVDFPLFMCHTQVPSNVKMLVPPGNWLSSALVQLKDPATKDGKEKIAHPPVQPV